MSMNTLPKVRPAGKRSDAYTLMRNARFCMTAAVRS